MRGGNVRVWLLSAAAFLYMAGVGATLAVFPLAVKAAGGTDFDVGVVIGAWSLVYLAANIPAGMLLDRAGPSRLVPLGFSMNALVAALYLGGSIPLYLAGRGLEGVFEALVWTGVFGYTAKENKGRGVLASFGTVYGSMALGFTLGPALGSAVYGAMGAEAVFLGLAALSLAAGAAAWAALRGVEPRGPRGRGVAPLGALKKPFVAASVALAFLVGMFESNLVSYSPQLAGAVGLPRGGGGYVISLYYLAGLVAQFSLRVLEAAVSSAAYPALVYMAVLAALALLRKGPGLALALVAAGFTNATNTSRVQARLSGALEGAESTAIGLGNAAWALGYTSGAPLHAAAAPGVGAVEWLLLLAAAMAATGVLLGWAERRAGLGAGTG